MRFSRPEPSFIESGGWLAAAQMRRVLGSGFGPSACAGSPDAGRGSCAKPGAPRQARAMRQAAGAAARDRPVTRNMALFPFPLAILVRAAGPGMACPGQLHRARVLEF